MIPKWKKLMILEVHITAAVEARDWKKVIALAAKYRKLSAE